MSQEEVIYILSFSIHSFLGCNDTTHSLIIIDLEIESVLQTPFQQVSRFGNLSFFITDSFPDTLLVLLLEPK